MYIFLKVGVKYFLFFFKFKGDYFVKNYQVWIKFKFYLYNFMAYLYFKQLNVCKCWLDNKQKINIDRMID